MLRFRIKKESKLEINVQHYCIIIVKEICLFKFNDLRIFSPGNFSNEYVRMDFILPALTMTHIYVRVTNKMFIIFKKKRNLPIPNEIVDRKNALWAPPPLLWALEKLTIVIENMAVS